VAILLPLMLGCRIDTSIRKRSIDELYGEAMAAAAVRPEAVRPGFHAYDPSDPSSFSGSDFSPGGSPDGPDLPRSSSGLPWGNEVQWDDEAERLDLPAPVDTSLTTPPTEQPIRRTRLKWNQGKSESVLVSFEDGEQKTSDGKTRMTDLFDQTDIREVVQILENHFKVSIVLDDSTGGVVSATAENETLEELLDKILLPMGLIYAQHEGKYLIAPADPQSPLFEFMAKRFTYSPAHHSIMSLTGLLPPRYRQFIQTSTDRNLAVIEAPDRIGNEILLRLKELDSPIGQVELEAIVCVVSPDSAFRFGLDWNHVVGADNAQSLKLGMAGLAMSGAVGNRAVQDAFSDFAVTSAFMRLLAQEGYITIRAAPRVTAKDGEKAMISLNRETFFSLQPDSSNVFFRQDVQKVEAGISLEIIPRIHGDLVAVEITKAEVSEDIRGSSSADISSNPYPIINRRVVSTKVNVRNGHTIVIGGLVQHQTVDRINQIPGLSRIPLAGKLFQSVEKLEQDVEVAIFISPRIVPFETLQCR